MQNPFRTSSQILDVKIGKKWLIGLSVYGERKFSMIRGRKGKRLSKPNSPYRELNGVSAAEYLNKAKTMFEEMDLQWDLEQLKNLS